MKLAAFLEKQAKKAGIDTTTDDWKAFVATALEIDVPETIATQMDSGLLNIEAAKSNDVLNKFFRSSHLGIADKRMQEIIDELGLEADDDFKGTTNTYDKIPKLVKLAKAAGEKKNKATSTGDAAEWAKKEKEYNDAIKQLKESQGTSDKAWQEKMNAKDVSFAMQKMLFGKDFIFPKEMDMDLQLNTALSAVTTDLAKNGHRLIIDENGQPKIVNKDGQPAYGPDNVALEPNTYFDGVLTRNKLLKVNNVDPDPANPQKTGSDFVPNPQKGNAAVAAELDQMVKNMPN